VRRGVRRFLFEIFKSSESLRFIIEKSGRIRDEGALLAAKLPQRDLRH
jgi:hypothetical protein